MPDHRLVVVAADVINQIFRSWPIFDALSIRVDYLLDVGAGLTVDRLESNQCHLIADQVAEDFGMRVFGVPSGEELVCDLLLLWSRVYEIRIDSFLAPVSFIVLFLFFYVLFIII